MPIFVGVDAGGTATSVVVERDGVRAGKVEAAAANLRTAGIERAASIISQAVTAATNGAHPDALLVGSAGAGHPELAGALQARLTQAFPQARVRVVDDAMIALRAAVPAGDGIVVVAGTGSIAYAVVDATSYRAGGHGFLLGDEGSGAAIGSAAVRLVLRAYDGRVPRDGFVEAIASVLDAESALDVTQAIYSAADPIQKLASVAPVVLACAADGDRSATKIVQAAALELADLIKAVVRTAHAAEREMPIVLAGGLFAQNSLLTYLVETRIINEYPKFIPMKNPPQPVYGALAMAGALQ